MKIKIKTIFFYYVQTVTVGSSIIFEGVHPSEVKHSHECNISGLSNGNFFKFSPLSTWTQGLTD